MMRIKARESKKRGTTRPSIELPKVDDSTRASRPRPAVAVTPPLARPPAPAPRPPPPPPRRRETLDLPIEVEASIFEAAAEEEHGSTQRRERLRTDAPPARHEKGTEPTIKTAPLSAELAERVAAEQAAIDEEPADTLEPVSRVTKLEGGPSAVSGKLVLSVLRFVARKYGERALKDLLDALPADARAPFQLGIEADGWVDYGTLRGRVEKIDARRGEEDHPMVRECGRAAAEGAFEVMRRLRAPSPPPELLLAEMPSVMQSLYQGLELQVRRLGKGYGRLELVESAPSLTTSVLVLGFLERSLERFGAEDVEVTLLGSRSLDDEQTLIDVSWLG
jgi:hypothetical protein